MALTGVVIGLALILVVLIGRHELRVYRRVCPPKRRQR